MKKIKNDAATHVGRNFVALPYINSCFSYFENFLEARCSKIQDGLRKATNIQTFSSQGSANITRGTIINRFNTINN